MFGEVVYGISPILFSHATSKMVQKSNKESVYDLTAKQLDDLCKEFEGIYAHNDVDVPDKNTKDFICKAVEAVFRSWNNPQAIAYRDAHGIPHDIGTACTVQTMVFGNLNNKSGTGVVFTRDPSDGTDALTGF